MAVEDPSLRASLYVGDLHPEVTEDDLVEVFGQVGPLLSVHICRDKLSRRSLCYGYVNFWFRCHASTALKCLNHSRLRGKSIRIMWCQRNPIARKNSTGNLFVKNLDQSITGARLQEIFSKYGTIHSCKVTEEKGISKGFGFVQFDSEDSAMAALNTLHGTVLEGKKLYVSKFLKKAERKDAESGFRNLYVKKLDDSVTVDLLKDKFSEYGKVSSVVIMKDEKGKSKGFGFVHFGSHEEAKKAMESLNGELLGSKNLFVSWAQKKDVTMQHCRQLNGYKCIDISKQATASNLYVKNLNPSVDDRKLKELFSHYGKVASAKVIRNGDGVSKKFGFVHFSSPDDAEKALDSLIGTDFEGKTLHVALAGRKEQQTSNLQKNYAEFQPLSLYTSNYQALPCNSPYFSSIPVIQLNQWHPTLYQNFSRSFSSFSSFQAQDLPGIFSKFHPQIVAWDGFRQAYNPEIWQQFSKSQNSIICDAKEYCTGQDVKKISSGMPSSVVSEIGTGYVCRPLLQNIQIGFAATCPGLPLEMAKHGSRSLLKQDPWEEHTDKPIRV